jgi:hypothetical protein
VVKHGGVLVNSCFGWKRIGSGEDVAEVGIEKKCEGKEKKSRKWKKMLPLQLK